MTRQASPSGKLHLRKVLANIAWIFVERLWKTALGLIVFIVLARHLGPQNYGSLSLALAILTIFAALGGFGVNNVVIRRIVSDPVGSSATLGSAFAILVGSFAFSLLVMYAYIWLLSPYDPLTQTLALVVALTLLFRPCDVVRMWFEAHLRSRDLASIELPVSLLGAAVKIWLAIAGAPLMAFAIATTMESLFLAVALVLLYHFLSTRRQDASAPALKIWSVRLSDMRNILTEAWPLLFTSIAVIFYMRIDQLMIGAMLGPREVGLYSAAVKISESWYFVITAIVTSLFPSMIVMKERGSTKYQDFMRALYGALFAVTVLVAVFSMVCSQPLVRLVLGSDYAGSAPILSLHIWTGVFVALGFLSSRQLVAEKLEKIVMLRTLVGCIVNIPLNYVLIPPLGAVGAAWATLVSQALASVLITGVFGSSRAIFKDQLAGFLVHRYIMPSRLRELTAEIEYQVGRAERAA
jgi:PST family polysaccharide transporter